MTVLSFEVFAKASTEALSKVVVQLDALNAKIDKMAVKRINIPVTVEDKGAVTKLSAVNAASKEVSKSSGEVAAGLGGRLTTALLGVAAAAGLASVGAVSIALKFQDATAQLAASANITQEAAKGIGDEFLKTAGKTTFTAASITGAYSGVAARLGQVQGHALNAAQAMEVMDAAMAAAEATGGDLTATTDALAKVMAAYSIGASGAAHASDVLTNASRLTNTPIADLAGGIDKLHAKLGPLSPSLEDTSALIVDMGNKGITGTKGILAVNSAFVTLTTGGKATQGEIEALGLKVKNSSGNFVGLSSVIAQLNPKLAAMGTIQREAALKALFGASAAGIMGGIIADGSKAYDKLSQSIGVAGSAEDAAAKATDTVKAKMEKFTSGIKDLVTQVGERLLPAAGKLLDWMTGIIPALDKLGSLIARNKDIITPFAQAIGILAVAFVSLFVVTKVAAAVKAAFIAIGFGTGPVGWIVLALAALLTGFMALWDNSKAFRDFWIGLWKDIQSAVSDAVSAIAPLVKQIGDSISGIGGGVKQAFNFVTGKTDEKGRAVTPNYVSKPAPYQPPDLADTGKFSVPVKGKIVIPQSVGVTPFDADTGAASRPSKTGASIIPMGQYTPALGTPLPGAYTASPYNLTSGDTGVASKPHQIQAPPQDLSGDIGAQDRPRTPRVATQDTSASNVPGMWTKVWDKVKEVTGKFVDWLKKSLNGIVDFFRPQIDKFKKLWSDIWPDIKNIIDKFTQWFKVLWPIIWNVIKIGLGILVETFKFAWNVIGGVVTAVIDVIIGVVKGVIKIFSGIIDFLTGVFTGNWSEVWKGITEIFSGIWDIVSGIFKGIWDVILGILKGVWQVITDIFGGIWKSVTDWVVKIWNDVIGFIVHLAEDIGKWIGKIADSIWNWVSGVWKSVTDWFGNIWHDVVKFIQNLHDDIFNWIGKIADKVGTWAENLWHAVVNKFGAMKDELVDIFKAIANFVFVNPINFIVNTVVNKGLNDLLSFVGNIFGQHWGVNVPAIPQFATGGIVPGHDTGKDTVHAMLRPKEGILTPEAVQRLGGERAVHALNRGHSTIPGHYSFGGIVGNLFGEVTDGAGKLFGKAVNWTRGLVADGAQGVLDSTIYPMMGPYNPGKKNDVANSGVFAVHHIGEELIRWIRGRDKAAQTAMALETTIAGTPGFIGPVSGGVTQWTPQILAALSELGANAGLLPHVLRRMYQESGGNPTIVNYTDSNFKAGTPSVGLMQVIGPTFRAYAGPHAGTGPYEFGVSVDPLSNIYAGLNYAQHRYPSIQYAMDKSGGYENGGFVNRPTFAKVGEGYKPELILPLSKPARTAQLLSSAGIAPKHIAIPVVSTKSVPVPQPRFVAQTIAGSGDSRTSPVQMELHFTGNLDSALADMLMKMIRDRKIQIKQSQVIRDR